MGELLVLSYGIKLWIKICISNMDFKYGFQIRIKNTLTMINMDKTEQFKNKILLFVRKKNVRK